jgi:hypothetical protein
MAEQAIVAPALAVLAAFIVVSFALYLTQYPARFADFRAFYCAGSVVRTGADPYRQHPLHECEARLTAPLLSPLGAEITVPAPFPGIVLAGFALLSLVPFAWATVLATLGSAAALACAIRLLAALTAAPLGAVAIVVGFPALVVPLPLGQPTPLILLGLCGSAALLSAGRPRTAALALAATAFDPHVALAALTGMFAAVPRARLAIVAVGAALAGASVLAAGPAREWEYVHSVLPAHALANVPEFSQFSTASFAYLAGVPAPLALAIGNAWYVGSLFAGAFAAVRLRARLGPCAAVFVPTAFAVFGGAHTHLQQLALAVPAALLVASSATGRRRAVLVAATFVAAAPWLIFCPFPVLFAAIAVLGAAFARLMDVGHISAAFGLAVFWLATGLCASVALTVRPYVAVPFHPAGNPLAEVAWGRFVNAIGEPAQLWVVLAKLPTIAAFAVLLAILLRMSLNGARAGASA